METLQNIFQMEIIQRLGWTLVHFVWQATTIGIALAIAFRLLRKSSANLRYAVGCMALLLIVLMPAVTMRLVNIRVPAFDPVKLKQLGIDLPKAGAAAQALVEMPQATLQVNTAPMVSLKDRFIKAVEPALPYVVIGWLVGVFGLSLWHLGGWTQLQRLRRQMIKQVTPTLKAKLQQLSNMLGIQKTIGLVESALVQVPTIVGHLKPVILLPASALTGLSSEQIEAILAHELAHIKRCDYLVNILQTVVEILGFYHPAVWWISDKIRVERENCCDDIAVSLCSNSLSYARALTTMEKIRFGQPALAVAASGGSLFDRIRRLLGKDSTNEMKLSRLPSAIAILLIMTLMISALLIPMACNQTRQTALETLPAGKIVDKIIVPGLRVGEYTFDISKDDVLESLGKPNHIFYGDKKYTLDNLPRTYYMLFDDVSFRILDDSVKEITAVSPYYKLANGLGVGDSVQKIKQAFGNDYHLKETEWKDFLAYEDKGLVFEIDKNDRTVMEIGVSPFGSLKFHKKADIPATSTINEDGHIVDKIDYPFVNDSQVIGTWKGVDFVREIEDFKVDEQQWEGRGGELFLHEMIFIKNGRLISKNDNVPRGYPGTWTKGLVFYDNDTVTASKYHIKEKDGSTYMFYEWKSGDYTFRHRKPSYYVLKKVSSETSGHTHAPIARPVDPEFAAQLPSKIEKLDIDTADLQQVKEIFGEPAQYIWGNETFTEDDLPGRYILVYPSSFHIFMSDNKIVEIRHEHGSNYVFRDKIRSGSTLNEVFDVIGSPEKTVEGEENEFKDGVLYKDIDGNKGHCYYARSDLNVRLWFWEYKTIAIYMTRSDYGSGAAPRKGLLGLRLDEKRWPVVDIIPEMPAEQAGLQNGDKILRVNDKDITHLTTTSGILKVLNGAGQKVKLAVERDGQLLDFQVERSKARDNKIADKSQNEIRWAKIIEARSNPQIIHKAAYDLFEKIKNADYDYFLSADWEQFPIVEYYNSYRDYPELVRWICTTFKENPIVSIELGDVSFGDGWPRIYYKLILKNAAVLEGDLLFKYHFYHSREGRWHGIHGHYYDGPQTSYKVHGLDWHLQKIQ